MFNFVQLNISAKKWTRARGNLLYYREGGGHVNIAKKGKTFCGLIEACSHNYGRAKRNKQRIKNRPHNPGKLFTSEALMPPVERHKNDIVQTNNELFKT